MTGVQTCALPISEYIVKVTKAALEVGMGVNTHCIGTRGTRLCIDAYEEALKAVPVTDHRLRVEHAQIVRPEDVEKFRILNIIPSMQPTHATSDMGFVADRVGEKRLHVRITTDSLPEDGTLSIG